ncbi:MAG: DUF4397 domain-containing protein, partial [Pedobacter sp.]|nr:DUF4397 domain-containing protein [Pedobacter sp.]
KDRDDIGTSGSITFANTVEGSAAQDTYVDDSKTNSSGLAYGSASGNVSVATGNRTIAFKNTGTATATAAGTVNVGENTSTTVFLVKNTDGSLAISSYANDNASVSGKAKVRFINVAPLLSSTVNVLTSTGASLVSALSFKVSSAYQTIDANTALNVNVSGSLETTAIAGSEFQAGKVYTVWFDNSTTTKVKYHVIVHN